VNSFLILKDVFSFEFVSFVTFVFSRASVISYVIPLDMGVPSSSKIILKVSSSPGL